MVNQKPVLIIAAAINGSLALPGVVTDCQALCDRVPACRTNANIQGSYCKTENDPSVCFGMYYRDIFRTRVCYSPADPTCPQAIPVRCTEAARAGLTPESTDAGADSATEPAAPESGDANLEILPPSLVNDVSPRQVGQSICETICLLTPNCAFDPNAHGTYCKDYNDPPVCFGLYFRVFPFRVCFEPNDATCPETRPVPCGFDLATLQLEGGATTSN